MAVINIASKLSNEPTYIEIGENKKYKVNDSYKTLMRASALFDSTSNQSDAMMKALELLIGKEAREEIEDMSLSNVKAIFTAVMAAVQGTDYDEAEARFQE